MMPFAFISRHKATEEQIALAKEKCIKLIPVGDRDAFSVEFSEFAGKYDGVIVVHPAMALRLISPLLTVGVFESANRSPEGERPVFEAKQLHLFATHHDMGLDCLDQPVCQHYTR